MRQVMTDASIEHVGSTAVPGLGAKPVIDIMLGVSALLEVEARIAQLGSRGYEYVPEHEAQLPARRYFVKPPTRPRTFHLHCVVRGSDFWQSHLEFRDFLREHPEMAAAYLELKQELAARFRTDRVAYTDGKSAFISSILEKPRRLC
jgi:GrpB-like predicted nucleotidyltransferase (UPF0157 family)